MKAAAEFISVGANRHPHASDYSPSAKEVVYGAGRTLAIWDIGTNAVLATLKGHSKDVTAVKYISADLLVSGSADSTLKLWKRSGKVFECVGTIQAHTKSVTALNVYDDLVVSGSADGEIKFWRSQKETLELLDTQKINDRFYPLASSAYPLDDGWFVVAIGGTSNHVYVFTGKDQFKLEATMQGHENWVRTLSFTGANDDIILASGSQDRYIRLWRFHLGDLSTIQGRTAEETDLAQLMSNKAHYINDNKYCVTFEALIMGHDDWVFSVRWHASKLQLLSCSADSSAIIWHPDESSGVWVGMARLGDLSIKGSTSATGSSGGFWAALWLDDESITALGRTGSWRRWSAVSGEWKSELGITGNTRETTDVSWEDSGRYLLSTSLDQTSRLYAKSKKDGQYHELSRPQIHGYDMVAMCSINPTTFVSAGDEKILRVFHEPKGIACMLEKVAGIETASKESLAESAIVPVLGLSNKQENEMDTGDADDAGSENVFAFLSELDHPPLEDHLQRLTLWPEADKLYGHGYEICCLDVSHDKSVIATCCRANSETHAVVRLFDTKTWHQLPYTLAAHSLTINSIRFSPDDRYILTVSRDRTWALWERGAEKYELSRHETKGHSRIIWDAAWVDETSFITAGRDKLIKLWKLDGGKWVEVDNVRFSAPVSAIDVKNSRVVIGLDTGVLALLKVEGDKIEMVSAIDQAECPDARVAKLRWSPTGTEIAVCSDDASLRIFNVQ